MSNSLVQVADDLVKDVDVIGAFREARDLFSPLYGVYLEYVLRILEKDKPTSNEIQSAIGIVAALGPILSEHLHTHQLDPWFRFRKLLDLPKVCEGVSHANRSKGGTRRAEKAALSLVEDINKAVKAACSLMQQNPLRNPSLQEISDLSTVPMSKLRKITRRLILAEANSRTVRAN